MRSEDCIAKTDACLLLSINDINPVFIKVCLILLFVHADGVLLGSPTAPHATHPVRPTFLIVLYLTTSDRVQGPGSGNR